MCILIVDDHLSLLTLLTIFLEDIGYEVVTVRNGREALAWLRHSSALPGLILLDLAMPVMTGGEFLREQQRDSRLAALPVILMTALGRFDYEVTTASVVAHLEKPLELDALATLLHEYAEPQLVARAVGG
ncbi:MAG TPA: response regulator [Roseiflexaceae bacterium]|nr:response regulator [Roseiflexaceae bacterium]